MTQRLDVDGDVNRVFDQLQHENAVHEREQREKRQQTELDLLGGDISFREYRQRRAEMADLVVEPELPLDEMDYKDYAVARRSGAETMIDPANVVQRYEHEEEEKCLCP